MTKKQEYNPNMRGAIWTETRVTTVTDSSGKPKIVSPAFSGKIMVDGKSLLHPDRRAVSGSGV